MIDSLFAKTFLLLSSQLLATLLAAVLFIRFLRSLYGKGVQGITATKNERGELDLHVDNGILRPYVWPFFIAYWVLFFLLIFVGVSVPLFGFVVFTLWSLSIGVMLALAAVRIDENFAARVAGLTALVTFACAWIGMFSGVDFSFLQEVLFWGLLALLLAYTIRLFVKIPGDDQRVTALFGVVIFVGYLLFDFHRLAELQKRGENGWSAAMRIAIDIYLDIINLFLDLLELLAED